MSFKIGDAVFDRNGQPGLIIEQDKKSSEFIVEKNQKNLKTQHRHGYINGLKSEERKSYLEFMDQVTEIENPREKIGALQEHIDGLKGDPKQFKMVRYLEAELFHVMNNNNISPRTYKIHVSDI